MMKMPVFMRNKLMENVGAHAMCLPTVIDSETARHIESIDPDTYAKDLREILQDEDSVQSAVSRLMEAKTHVAQLAANGKVIDTNSWNSLDTQKMVAQGQKEQTDKLTGVNNADPDTDMPAYRATEFFAREFKFMMP